MCMLQAEPGSTGVLTALLLRFKPLKLSAVTLYTWASTRLVWKWHPSLPGLLRASACSSRFNLQGEKEGLWDRVQCERAPEAAGDMEGLGTAGVKLPLTCPSCTGGCPPPAPHPGPACSSL